MHINIESIESPQPSHYNLIKSLYNQSFINTGHEPLNEQMLLSLEHKVYGVPQTRPKPGKTLRQNQELNLSISFSCAYFGIVDQNALDAASSTNLSHFLQPLPQEEKTTLSLPGSDTLSYLQLSYGYEQWYMALVLPKDFPELPHLAKQLVTRGIRYVKDRGGRQIQLFSPMDSTLIGSIAKEADFEESFTLFCMKKELSSDPPQESFVQAKNVEKISIRTFRPGEDEWTWLELNRRAFATHKEQGKWSLGDFLYRENMPWFDPEGLLILEIENHPAGFCWTKVIKERPIPPYNISEIYILGLDSQYRGRGLGKTLLLAGIQHLEKSGTPICYLYTDSTNTTAISLYQNLGFTLDHKDKIYVLEL